MFKDILTKELLDDVYTMQKKSIAAIARDFGTTTTTVWRYIKFYKIPLNDNPFKPKDITGNKFGQLVAIKAAPKDKHKKSRWLCKCDCGKTIIVNYSSLVKNLTKSCGCNKLEKGRAKGYKDISFSWWRRTIKSAITRGINFDLTMEDVWHKYEEQGGKCIMTNLAVTFSPNYNKIKLQTASLDRIDSNLGYIKGNIQIVHKVINHMKGFLTSEEFIGFCNLVAKTHEISNENILNKITSRQILKK